MHLISCDSCATVFDQYKLAFAEDVYTEDGSVDDTKASYNQKTGAYVASIPCPVCGEHLLKE